MKDKKSLFLVVLAIMAVVVAGFHFRWYGPLIGDSQYYFGVGSYFWQDLSFKGFELTRWERIYYPPGANLFFIILGVLRQVRGLEMINIILLLVLTGFIKNRVRLTLVIVCLGPIVLYRFDLLVVVFMILGLLKFKSLRFGWAGVFLGLGAVVKIFPVFLLPYLIYLESKLEKKVFWKSRTGIFFWVTVILTTFFYGLISGQSFLAVVSGLSYHAGKSVAIDSVWGSLLTVTALLRFPMPQPVYFANGVFVLGPIFLLGPDRMYQLGVVGGLGVLGVLGIWKRKLMKAFDWRVVSFILLTVIIASPVLSPQYLSWVAFLFLLWPVRRVDFVIFLVVLLLTAYVYPLNYDTFVYDFYMYNRGWAYYIFWINTLRNVLLILLWVRLLLILRLSPPASTYLPGPFPDKYCRR